MKSNVSRNPRLLFWGRAFFEIKMMTAVTVLFYLSRDMSLEQVFYMSIVWSIVAIATEVPSGYLADKIGRKRTLILGVLLMLGAHIATLIAYGPWAFAGIFVLMSASFSCFSGTDEALLYESLKEIGKEEEMTKHNGRLMSARTIFKLFIPLIGAFVARDLLDWQFQLLIWVNIAAVLLSLAFLLRLVEPKRIKSVFSAELGVFRQSIDTIRNHPWLLKASLNKILIFIAVFITWRIYQPLLAESGMSIMWLGVFDVIGYIILTSMRWNTDVLVKWFGAARYIALTAWIGVAFLVVSILATNLWLDFVALALVIGVISGREPAFAHAINQRIESRSRATTLSNLNMIKSVLDIPIFIVVAQLTLYGYDTVLMLAASLCVITLVLLPLREHELKPLAASG